MSYAKLDQAIITSSIWSEDDQTRIIWITMLAMKNQHGEVQGSIVGLARVANVPLEAAQRAVAILMAPDKHSRSKEFEGRRIEEIPGGWFILNHERFRALDSDEDRKAQAAERQRRSRARRKEPVTENVTVTRDSVISNARAPHTDADAEPKTDPNADPDPNPDVEAKADTASNSLELASIEPEDEFGWPIPK